MVPSKKNLCTALLVIINILVYLYDIVFIGPIEIDPTLIEAGAGVVALITDGEYYRLFTAMFVHSSVEHLLGNMLILYVMGSVLETEIGRIRYLIIYFGGGLISSWVSYQYYLSRVGNVIFMGASGAVFSLIGAVLFLSVLGRGRVRGYSSRQLLLYILFSMLYGFTTEGVGNAAHLGGLISGFVLAVFVWGLLGAKKYKHTMETD